MNQASNPPDEVAVSVCMITYNHEPYIAGAIESVLMQKTKFPVELVIGDDCSTDGTRDIVLDFAERYPGRIRMLLPKFNQGVLPNFVATLNACKDKYIALCEGDDYWIDPYKLQKQVDYLECHQECAICFTNVDVRQSGVSPYSYISPHQKDISNLEDLMVENFIPTCSVMFRNMILSEVPNWYFDLGIGDWPLYILLAQYGKIGFVKDKTAVYRIHPNGIWSGADQIKRLEIGLQARMVINSHFNFKYRKILGKPIFKYTYSLSKIYFQKNDNKNTKIYIYKCMPNFLYQNFKLKKDFIKFCIKVFSPWIYTIYQNLKITIIRSGNRSW